MLVACSFQFFRKSTRTLALFVSTRMRQRILRHSIDLIVAEIARHATFPPSKSGTTHSCGLMPPWA